MTDTYKKTFHTDDEDGARVVEVYSTIDRQRRRTTVVVESAMQPYEDMDVLAVQINQLIAKKPLYVGMAAVTLLFKDHETLLANLEKAVTSDDYGEVASAIKECLVRLQNIATNPVNILAQRYLEQEIEELTSKLNELWKDTDVVPETLTP